MGGPLIANVYGGGSWDSDGVTSAKKAQYDVSYESRKQLSTSIPAQPNLRAIGITQVRPENAGRKVVFGCTGFMQNFFTCFSPLSAKDKARHRRSQSDLDGNLLPSPRPEDVGKMTLVLDLDESIVHSSFQPTADPDFVLPFAVGDNVYTLYVSKRPGLDEFLARMGRIYEVVVWTASIGKYANPLIDLLDLEGQVRTRLFRDACVLLRGAYVKDLTRLGRPLSTTVIIDNSPSSYALQPGNAVPVTSWFGAPDDRELAELSPFLEKLARTNDVPSYLSRTRPFVS